MPISMVTKFSLLDSISDTLKVGAKEVANFTAQMIAAEVQQNIMEGEKTGRIYKYGPKPLPHQTSAPGEAPANWTGALAHSVRFYTTGNQTKATATLTIKAKYGALLEFGTSRMAARPFLQPACDVVYPFFVAAMIAMVENLGIPHYGLTGDPHLGIAQRLPK